MLRLCERHLRPYRRVDPRRRRWRERLGRFPDEALRMSGVGRRQHRSALLDDGVCLAVVDGLGGEQAEGIVAMLGVVPGEEALTERPGVLDRAEPLGNVGWYFSVRNWASE